MEILKFIKIELLCLSFGLLGMVITITTNKPEMGISLVSTSITSYFAFKKTDDDISNND